MMRIKKRDAAGRHPDSVTNESAESDEPTTMNRSLGADASTVKHVRPIHDLFEGEAA